MTDEVVERDRQKQVNLYQIFVFDSDSFFQIILATYDDNTLIVSRTIATKLRDDPELDLYIQLQFSKEIPRVSVRCKAIRIQTTSKILDEFPENKDTVSMSLFLNYFIYIE